MRILTTAGVESEMNLPFAGLHQLLHPILHAVVALPPPQREAIRAAFGMVDSAAPNLFLIALATLTLLSDAAAGSPLVLIADDAQWLDRTTCDALAFVARRLESEPVVLLVGIREGFESPLVLAGLPKMNLEGLEEAAAGALLDSQAPRLDPTSRERVLEEAAGNPLALVELPTALESYLDGGVEPPSPLPLTERLERAFAARAAELSSATRALLLVAAVDDVDSLDEVLTAGALVHGSVLTVEALAPAVSARLIDVRAPTNRHRHYRNLKELTVSFLLTGSGDGRGSRPLSARR